MDEVFAFDTGPGNMIINSLMKRFYNLPYDKDGEIAGSGLVNKGLLDLLLDDDYIKKPPPKSTGREKYGESFVDQLIESTSLSKKDLIATVTQFTALAITKSLKGFDLSKLIVSGGGVHNKIMMNHIKRSFPGKVISIEEEGINPGAKEAMAFALLAYETLSRRPSNIPSATGAKKYVIQGSITYP
jgi:anhydro-N-acetylmuramic acid kinase